MENNELLPLVDLNGNVIGSAPRGDCHGGKRLLHPVVHLHLFDSNGRLLLQHRAKTKVIQPGKWDTAVGGHVAYGETIYEALRRETAEEIGLHEFEPRHVTTYLFENNVERELINCFIALAPENFVPRMEESDIDALQFFSSEELFKLIESGATTPNFASEYTEYIIK